MEKPAQMVKMLFELDPDDWHGGGAETLWAESSPQDGLHAFKISNSPFCVRGISFGDIVNGTPTKHEGVYEFAGVLKRGGHSTFMLLMEPGDNRVPSYWQSIERLGCSYERGQENLSVGVRTLYSVDVPPATNLSQVYDMLERGLDDGVWLVQEGYVYGPDHD